MAAVENARLEDTLVISYLSATRVNGAPVLAQMLAVAMGVLGSDAAVGLLTWIMDDKLAKRYSSYLGCAKQTLCLLLSKVAI